MREAAEGAVLYAWPWALKPAANSGTKFKNENTNNYEKKNIRMGLINLRIESVPSNRPLISGTSADETALSFVRLGPLCRSNTCEL